MAPRAVGGRALQVEVTEKARRRCRPLQAASVGIEDRSALVLVHRAVEPYRGQR